MSFDNLICNTINGISTLDIGASQGPVDNINTADGSGGWLANTITLAGETISSTVGDLVLSAGVNSIQLNNPVQLSISTSALVPGTSTMTTYLNRLTPGTANIIDSADSSVVGTVGYMVTKVGNVVTWLFGTSGGISFSGLGVNSFAIIDLEIPVDLAPYGQIKCGAFLDADVGTPPADLEFISSAAINYQVTSPLPDPITGKFQIVDTSSPVVDHPKAFGVTDLDGFPLTISYICVTPSPS